MTEIQSLQLRRIEDLIEHHTRLDDIQQCLMSTGIVKLIYNNNNNNYFVFKTRHSKNHDAAMISAWPCCNSESE